MDEWERTRRLGMSERTNLIAVSIWAVIEILLLVKKELSVRQVGSENIKKVNCGFTLKGIKNLNYRLSKYPHQFYLI